LAVIDNYYHSPFLEQAEGLPIHCQCLDVRRKRKPLTDSGEAANSRKARQASSDSGGKKLARDKQEAFQLRLATSRQQARSWQHGKARPLTFEHERIDVELISMVETNTSSIEQPWPYRRISYRCASSIQPQQCDLSLAKAQHPRLLVYLPFIAEARQAW